MGLRGALSVLLCAAGLTWVSDAAENAPAAPPQADLLVRVRAANQQLYSDLQSFVCKEQIVRYEVRSNEDRPRQIDKLTAKVSFENGVEQYTEVRQNNRDRSSISSISGAWSENEYGTLLQQTQLLLTTQDIDFVKNAELDGAPVAVYAFDVASEESPWDLDVGGEHYRVPFHTAVWVSRESGQILQIERSSTSTLEETQISDLRWSVRLSPIELNGHTWLLPNKAEYSVSYEPSQRREWNEMTFSDYRRYGSEVAVHFDMQ